jgi:hypothetical protein
VRSIALAALLALVACDGSDKGGAACVYMGTSHAVGDVFPASDNCNSCMCTAGGVSCTALACPDAGTVDANPLSCTASGGCLEGPACGTQCCGHGERCVNGTCQCASNPACINGNSCEGIGPVGGDQCGTICCGATGPCPQ